MVISYLARTLQSERMSSNFEDKKYEERKMKAYANRRAIMDYGMGILYLAGGIFLMLAHKLQVGLDILPAPVYTYLFAGLCLLYGGFRVYRGYKKNYFR
jgi:hypothetical protein